MLSPGPAPRLPVALAILLACLGVSACSSDSPGGGGTGGATAGATGGAGARAGSGGGAAVAGGMGGGGVAGSGGAGGSSPTAGSSGAGPRAAGGTSGAGGTVAGAGGTAAPSGGVGGAGAGPGGTGGGTAGIAGEVDTGGRGGSPVVDAAPEAPPGTGPLPPAVRKVVILHDAAAGASANDPSRSSMMQILTEMNETHGIVVEWMDSPTPAAALLDKALVIVGPNSKMFGENHPDPGLRTLPVPLMVSKDGNTTEIGLGRAGFTDPPTYNRITLVRTDHPLAAGLSTGSLVVLTTPNRQRVITFTDLGPDAIRIAQSPQNPALWSLIAYEKGGDMGRNLRAPARRVGFFWHRPAPVTPEGRKLFEAAVDWLLRSP